MAICPNDESVYVTSLFSNSVTSFTRSTGSTPATQKPGTAGCLIFLRSAGCSFGRALKSPEGIAVSPDGASVYAAAFSSNAIAVLDRKRSGAVAQKPGARRLPGAALGPGLHRRPGAERRQLDRRQPRRALRLLDRGRKRRRRRLQAKGGWEVSESDREKGGLTRKQLLGSRRDRRLGPAARPGRRGRAGARRLAKKGKAATSPG